MHHLATVQSVTYRVQMDKQDNSMMPIADRLAKKRVLFH